MAGRVGNSPSTSDFNKERPAADLWLVEATNRMNVYSGAANPTVAQVPENQWILYYNTALLELRFWSNIKGVLKKSAAFT